MLFSDVCGRRSAVSVVCLDPSGGATRPCLLAITARVTVPCGQLFVLFYANAETFRWLMTSRFSAELLIRRRLDVR